MTMRLLGEISVALFYTREVGDNMKVKLDVDKNRHPVGHQFTVVQCEKCGVFYEPYGKEHKCKKNKEDSK